MALTSVFYDGVVTETDRAKNQAGAPAYGVYGVGDFEVKAHPSIPYAVLVTSGRAHGWGVTDEAAIDQVVQCSTLASGTRWDLIAVRRNWQPALGGPSTLVALQSGVAAEIPAARKVGPGVEDDQPIALVKWIGGLSAPQQIIDLRVWPAAGGMVAKDELVRTYLTQIGTRVKIGANLWSYELLANNIPGWVNEDGSGPWVNLTLGTDWANNGGSQARARLVGRGAFLHVEGDVRYAGSIGAILEGWVVANLPAGLTPAFTTFVPGTTNEYANGAFYYVTPTGIKVGPKPVKKIVQFNGIAAMK